MSKNIKETLLALLAVIIFVCADFAFEYHSGIIKDYGSFDLIILYYVVWVSIRIERKL